ncbi:MAG: hypothetical protein ACQEXJ_11515 [Myxococcota bacterium]
MAGTSRGPDEHRWAAFAVALAMAFAGCDAGGEAPTRHEGGPGYPCYFDADCTSPLLCDDTPAAEFPVCTGTAGEGDPCGPGVACAWIRDERGLPLQCGADGTCSFPEEGRVPR